MKKIAVIGTGLSALSLAHHLPSLDITFFEKSWRPGGRISTRRHEDYAFDHGAHYIKEDHGVLGFNEYLENSINDHSGLGSGLDMGYGSVEVGGWQCAGRRRKGGVKKCVTYV